MQIGISVRRFFTFALVAILMLGSLVAPAPTMAQSQTYQSSLTGVNIAYEAPYQIFEDGVFVEEGMEILMFVGPADVLAMGFMSPLIDLNGARDILLETLFGEMGTASTIDRGDYSGVSYSLDMLNMDGQEMGVFSLFLNQRSHGFAEFYIFLAPPTLFGNSMQTAQNSFTIDGAPLMDGVDALAMGGMVTDNIGITGGEAVTDVTDVTEPEDRQTNTSETTQTTQTPETDESADPTVVVENDSDAADAGAYLESIQEHRVSFYQSFAAFNSSLGGLEGEPTDAELIAAFDGSLVEAEKWVGYSETARQLTPPPGYENVQAAYQAWADTVSEMGNIWVAALNGDSEMLEVFFDYIPSLEQAESDLDVAIIEAEEQSAASGDSSETTTRTTRSGGDETDTGSETDASSGRPSRSDRSSETLEGNTSETSGNSRSSRTGTGTGSEATEMPNEWVTDVTGATITWSDDLALYSQTDEPQVSDAAAGADEIWLETASGQYAIPVRVRIFENPASDSTTLINAVVNDPAQSEDIWGAGTVVHDSDVSAEASAALMHSEDEIGGYWIYVQVTCLDSSCGMLALLEIATEGTPMVETLGVIDSGLAVNGISVSGVLPVSDVQNVVEQIGD